MALAKPKKWWRLESREADLYPWDVSRLDHVLRQATAPKATLEKKLWCVKVILRCIETTVSEEQVELRRNRQLLPTLRYFLFQPLSTHLGARLRQHTLSVYLHLLGGDLAFDELLVMDAGTVRVLVSALGDDEHAELNHVALLLARRISELPHVSSVLVFEDSLFDVLQDLLEFRHVSPQVTKHILHLFVNLSGHPRLHFKLARSRRLVFFVIETLLLVLNTDIVEQTSRKMHRVMNSVPSHSGQSHVNSTKRNALAFSPALSKHVGCALSHMSTAVPCAMIIANLLSFPENRAPMLSLYPDLLRALELCDSQKVSIRLWEVARCAIDYLHEDETMMKTRLLMHFESPMVDDATVKAEYST
ncbi:hypothetical protein MOQ_008485 [Trypanosoma cruzi marinkellei]|uniref:Uncharacterized protein n=1 Tax=Trypanosoma cruzi marinkellei TaxID=85056 RepID=K2MKV3_TRYCR|nr:hypothetical protein MOQ_008485 [Trypanosoma cruzi marinkellei]